MTDATRPEPAGPEHLERRARVGSALRGLGHAVVGHELDDELLDELADALESFIARAIDGGGRARPVHNFQRGSAWSPPADGEFLYSTHDDRPVSGRSSPYGLDPVIRRVGDEVHATVTLHAAHEGAPTRSHGGIIAALFDDLYGFVLTIHQQPGFTGEICIRYEGATPLHVPLECVVRLARREGRKLFMTGELHAPDGKVVARSTTTFIAIDPSNIPGWGDGV